MTPHLLFCLVLVTTQHNHYFIYLYHWVATVLLKLNWIRCYAENIVKELLSIILGSFWDSTRYFTS